MIALSIALGIPAVLFVIAAWHVALRVVARRDAISALRHDVETYQDHVDKALLAHEHTVSVTVTGLATRLEAAEAYAADLGAVARDMRNARALGGKRSA